jgi:hypothetical protein
MHGEPSELELRYQEIVDQGFIIDVRGALPILIRGLEAWQCEYWMQALLIAEQIIEERGY